MKSNGGGDNGKYRIKVLQKAFRLLELFHDKVDELSATEITEKLQYNKTTVFRIISNLEEEGYLEKNPETGKYRLGMKLFFLGSLVKPYRHLKSTAKPLLRSLNQQTGETVHLAVLHKNQALYLDKIESNHTVRVVVSQVGQNFQPTAPGWARFCWPTCPKTTSRRRWKKPACPLLPKTPSPPGTSSSRSWTWCASRVSPRTTKKLKWGSNALPRRSSWTTRLSRP